MMTRKEMGIALGYGGIWHEIEYSEEDKAERAARPKKIFKYERVFDYDFEDTVLNENFHRVPRNDAKKKYFVEGDALYKLVNPKGELFSWMNGVDPIKEV